MLEECISDHGHERMTMKTMPRPTLEVVEAELLLQLLMGLLTDPSCLDCGSQAAQIHPGGQVGKIVFLLSGHAVLANEPSLVAGKVLLTFVPYPLRRPVSDAHTDRSKPGFQPAFRAAAPTHRSPLGTGRVGDQFERKLQLLTNQTIDKRRRRSPLSQSAMTSLVPGLSPVSRAPAGIPPVSPSFPRNSVRKDWRY